MHSIKNFMQLLICAMLFAGSSLQALLWALHPTYRRRGKMQKFLKLLWMVPAMLSRFGNAQIRSCIKFFMECIILILGCVFSLE